MIEKHTQVALTKDLPGTPFIAGDCGWVLNIYDNGSAYELEFVAGNGETIDMFAVEASCVRPLTDNDVHQVRIMKDVEPENKQ